MSTDTKISTQIQALQNDKANIRDAIINKGGTCASGNGFDDFATDIATIPSGSSFFTYEDIIEPTTETNSTTINTALPNNCLVYVIAKNLMAGSSNSGMLNVCFLIQNRAKAANSSSLIYRTNGTYGTGSPSITISQGSFTIRDNYGYFIVGNKYLVGICEVS